ncbi:hypothetical protein AZE42_04259 [Rhizopogon vesiculosus]|uniref:Uncharacterized protein n=1 Tax=Rhizopogon vesiculosus TaxID=180088 RepID=A0A1J8QMV8_9AGAM|nr:hypothetical protein AZE42_04259 [Rhizopogon vesiculosus]
MRSVYSSHGAKCFAKHMSKLDALNIKLPMIQRMPGPARKSNSESNFCVRVRCGIYVRFGPSETMQVSPSDIFAVKVYSLENNPSVVDAMVGNVSSPNWFFLLHFHSVEIGRTSTFVVVESLYGVDGTFESDHLHES